MCSLAIPGSVEGRKHALCEASRLTEDFGDGLVVAVWPELLQLPPARRHGERGKRPVDLIPKRHPRLLRLHPKGTVETDYLAVDVLILDQEPDGLCEFGRISEPGGIGDGCTKAVLRVLRQRQ